MTDDPEPPHPPVPAEPPQPMPGSGAGLPTEWRAVPSPQFAADLVLCRQHMATLAGYEAHGMAEVTARYPSFITADDVAFITELAARLRAAAGNPDPKGPSADILPFPRRGP